MNTEAFLIHTDVVEKQLGGRYVLPEKVNELILNLPVFFDRKIVGHSVENKPIYSITFGHGKMKVFMWSQMHGNESTTTRALFDFFNYLDFKKYAEKASKILENCTFCVIPMLNPDGSKNWTRENAHRVDLNRDAQKLTQPESLILRSIFDTFKPDYCFNLHGQRSIYGFEDTGRPSILSFLAPAAEVTRSFTFSRKRAASVITHIYKTLDVYLPNQIGLYDDSYNEDCVGDTFQALGAATVLFEAGHYPDDYDRSITRAFLFNALLAGVEAVIDGVEYSIEAYNGIPKHTKCFCDLHKVIEGSKQCYHYEEVLKDGDILYIEKPLSKELGNGQFAHKTENILKN